jgi:hypothetical protein
VTYTKDLNIGNIPVGQWFPNNIRGEIRIFKKNAQKTLKIQMYIDMPAENEALLYLAQDYGLRYWRIHMRSLSN